MRVALAALSLLMLWPTISAQACKLVSTSDVQSDTNSSWLTLSNAYHCYILGDHLRLSNSLTINATATRQQQPVLEAAWGINDIAAVPGEQCCGM
jgi:hypothetical protein